MLFRNAKIVLRLAYFDLRMTQDAKTQYEHGY